MKIIGLLAAMIFVLATGLATVEAKPYKALTEGCSPVEIPDELVLPDYILRLEYAETNWFYGTVLTVNSYRDPDYVYINEEGEEICPYMEIIKYEGDLISSLHSSLHLFGIFFANDENILEFYIDGENSNSPATGKLKKYVPPKEGKVQKVPREMRKK